MLSLEMITLTSYNSYSKNHIMYEQFSISLMDIVHFRNTFHIAFMLCENEQESILIRNISALKSKKHLPHTPNGMASRRKN